MCKRYLSLFNAGVKDIFFLLVLSEKNDTQAPPFHKRITLMSYKDFMNPLMKKGFTIFILYRIFIFKISLKYYCFFSKKNTYLNIRKFTFPLKGIFYIY